MQFSMQELGFLQRRPRTAFPSLTTYFFSNTNADQARNVVNLLLILCICCAPHLESPSRCRTLGCALPSYQLYREIIHINLCIRPVHRSAIRGEWFDCNRIALSQLLLVLRDIRNGIHTEPLLASLGELLLIVVGLLIKRRTIFCMNNRDASATALCMSRESFTRMGVPGPLTATKKNRM